MMMKNISFKQRYVDPTIQHIYINETRDVSVNLLNEKVTDLCKEYIRPCYGLAIIIFKNVSQEW